jgi:hypothetical protein
MDSGKQVNKSMALLAPVLVKMQQVPILAATM